MNMHPNVQDFFFVIGAFAVMLASVTVILLVMSERKEK